MVLISWVLNKIFCKHNLKHIFKEHDFIYSLFHLLVLIYLFHLLLFISFILFQEKIRINIFFQEKKNKFKKKNKWYNILFKYYCWWSNIYFLIFLPVYALNAFSQHRINISFHGRLDQDLQDLSEISAIQPCKIDD